MKNPHEPVLTKQFVREVDILPIHWPDLRMPIDSTP